MASLVCRQRPQQIHRKVLAATYASRASPTSSLQHERNKVSSPTEFNTSIKTLQETSGSNSSQRFSNRQLFARLQPDHKTMDMLDMLGLGSEKQGRFVRKKWFRYQEPAVKLPHMAFFAGAQSPSSFPKETLPEIGVVGRSNVGKSSLINQLCGSTTARVSDKPGLTQQINFYTAGRDFHLVDMPGYGFAYAKEEAKTQWQSLIESYIRQRKSLKRVMVLTDARHGIKASDKEFLTMLDTVGIKYQIVLTKCDLVHRTDLAKRHLLIGQEMAGSRHGVSRVMMVSAYQKTGLNELRKEILHICGLGKKHLALHKKKETIAKTEYLEQLKVFKDTARSKRK